MSEDKIKKKADAKSNLVRLPEKRSLQDMQDFVDVILMRGIKRVHAIIESETVSPKEQILAFNSIVNAGKYIYQRKAVEASAPKTLEIDDSMRIQL